MRSLKRIVILVILVLVSSVGLQVLAPPLAHASTSYTWTGKGNDGNWNNPMNWDPNGMPSDGDSVTIAPYPPDTLDADVTGVPQGLTLANFTLSGSSTDVSGGSLTVTGSFDWSGDGSLATSVTVNGTATISDNGQKILQSPDGSTIINLNLAGSTTVSGTGLALSGSGANIINTGTFTLQPGSLISGQVCCVSLAQFINQGSVVVLPSLLGSQSTIINAVAFNDQGKVNIGSNSTLELQTAPSTFAAGVSFSGGGTLLIDNRATVQLSGAVNLGSGTTFQLGLDQNNFPGTLTGTGTLSGSGTFSWTGGTLAANLTVASPVKTSISGNSQKVLDATFGLATGILTVGGKTTLSGTGLNLNGPAILTNTGTFTPQTGSTISAFSCCANPAQFVNKGTFTSDVGAGNTFSISGVAFNNSRTVDLKSGTFQFGGLDYTQTAGTTKLDGGSLTSTWSSPIVDLRGGSLTGQGVITASVYNAALIDPGSSPSSEGVITIIGNYTQTSAGTLRIDIKGSTTPGTGYDQLAVAGTVNLPTKGGALDIELVQFTPTESDSFTVVTFTTRTGQFLKLKSASANPAQYWVQYQATAGVLFFTLTRWGVDSDSTTRITSSNYSSVKQDLGTPDFWGRYIGDPKTSFSDGTCTQSNNYNGYTKDINKDEVTVAQSDKLPILPIYFNYPTTAVQGYNCGQNYATAAIEFAQHWAGPAIPQGTAIFVDIEGNSSVQPDANFILGWYDQFNMTFTYKSPYDGKMYTYNKGYYKAGYYADTGSLTAPSNFDYAYCTAVSSEPLIGTNSYIWTNRPGLSWTTKVGAPPYYEAIQPPCASQTFAWQYSGGSTTPPPINVDTDEAVSGLPLWHP
jgi:hypothetical protein